MLGNRSLEQFSMLRITLASSLGELSPISSRELVGNDPVQLGSGVVFRKVNDVSTDHELPSSQTTQLCRAVNKSGILLEVS